MQLQQQIEAMQKRAQYYEDELKESDQKIKLLSKEMEQKSRLLQLYILKTNANDLTSNSKFNINQMSSLQTMQKMDASVLAGINARMQKLLEEMTVKVLELELKLKERG